MRKLRLVSLLLFPSDLSLGLSALLSFSILLLSNWSFLIRTPLLYDYFFGPSGLVTLLEKSSGSISAFTQTIFAGPFTYNVVVLVVAALVGLLVYLFLEGFDRIVLGTEQTLSGIRDPNQTYSREVKVEAGTRLTVRVISFIVWWIYWIIFGKILLPFSILAFRTGVNDPFTRQGLQYTAIGLVVLLLAFHMHVILLRLFMLRVRILGVAPDQYMR